MIFKGNQRAVATRWSYTCLMAGKKSTRYKQYMYSLSLNPPQDAQVPIADSESTLETIGKRPGLDGHPRVLVFHEKEGRLHVHCV